VPRSIDTACVETSASASGQPGDWVHTKGGGWPCDGTGPGVVGINGDLTVVSLGHTGAEGTAASGDQGTGDAVCRLPEEGATTEGSGPDPLLGDAHACSVHNRMRQWRIRRNHLSASIDFVCMPVPAASPNTAKRRLSHAAHHAACRAHPTGRERGALSTLRCGVSTLYRCWRS